MAGDAQAGNRRRILVSSIEHKCVLAAGRALQEQLGYQLELLPVDAYGFVDQTILKNTLSDDVLAVSIMAVNNEIGTIEDIVGFPGSFETVTRSFIVMPRRHRVLST